MKTAIQRAFSVFSGYNKQIILLIWWGTIRFCRANFCHNLKSTIEVAPLLSLSIRSHSSDHSYFLSLSRFFPVSLALPISCTTLPLFIHNIRQPKFSSIRSHIWILGAVSIGTYPEDYR